MANHLAVLFATEYDAKISVLNLIGEQVVYCGANVFRWVVAHSTFPLRSKLLNNASLLALTSFTVIYWGIFDLGGNYLVFRQRFSLYDLSAIFEYIVLDRRRRYLGTS